MSQRAPAGHGAGIGAFQKTACASQVDQVSVLAARLDQERRKRRERESESRRRVRLLEAQLQRQGEQLRMLETCYHDPKNGRTDGESHAATGMTMTSTTTGGSRVPSIGGLRYRDETSATLRPSWTDNSTRLLGDCEPSLSSPLATLRPPPRPDAFVDATQTQKTQLRLPSPIVPAQQSEPRGDNTRESGVRQSRGPGMHGVSLRGGSAAHLDARTACVVGGRDGADVWPEDSLLAKTNLAVRQKRAAMAEAEAELTQCRAEIQRFEALRGIIDQTSIEVESLTTRRNELLGECKLLERAAVTVSKGLDDGVEKIPTKAEKSTDAATSMSPFLSSSHSQSLAPVMTTTSATTRCKKDSSALDGPTPEEATVAANNGPPNGQSEGPCSLGCQHMPCRSRCKDVEVATTDRVFSAEECEEKLRRLHVGVTHLRSGQAELRAWAESRLSTFSEHLRVSTGTLLSCHAHQAGHAREVAEEILAACDRGGVRLPAEGKVARDLLEVVGKSRTEFGPCVAALEKAIRCSLKEKSDILSNEYKPIVKLCEARRGEGEALRSQLIQLKQSMQGLELACAAEKRRVETLTRTIEDLRAAAREAAAESRSAVTDTEARGARELERQRDMAGRELSRVQDELAIVQERLRTEEQAHQETRDRVESTCQRQAKEASDAHRVRADALKDDLDKKSSEHKMEIRVVNDALERARSDCDRLIDDLAAEKAQVAWLRSQLQRSEQNDERIKSALEATEARYAQLRAETDQEADALEKLLAGPRAVATIDTSRCLIERSSSLSASWDGVSKPSGWAAPGKQSGLLVGSLKKRGSVAAKTESPLTQHRAPRGRISSETNSAKC